MSGASPGDTQARPWLAEYPHGIAADVDLGMYASLAEVVERAASRFGSLVAFHQLAVDCTFRQLDEYSARLAAYLQQDLDLLPGDRIALMMPNVIQYPVALFAALRAGLVVVNINPLYTAPELVSLVSDAAPRAIIVLETFAATVQQALRTVAIGAVIVARIAELQPFPRKLIVDYVVRRKKRLVPRWTIAGAVRFRDALLVRPRGAFRPPPLSHETIALLQYTGGTTGAPKAAVLTHGNVLGDLLVFAQWCAPALRPGAETFLIALPLYHVAALVCQCLLGVHYGAKSVLVINPRDMKALVADFAAHRPTVFLGLNTLFTALMNSTAFRQLDFTSLHTTMAGGAATQPAVADRWQAMTGRTILEGYGLSETAGAVTGNPNTRTAFDGTIGVPLPSVTVEIRNEDGAALPCGQAGEICVKGPMVMQGYYNRPAETAQVLGADGFLATGDVGIMSEQGVIRIVDRKKDMILVSGFNVYPNEVENVLYRNPRILEAAVVGVADAQSGEAPVACVIRRDATLTEEDVIAFARASLAAYKVPRRVVFVEELPKTPVGKVLRRELRASLGA